MALLLVEFADQPQIVVKLGIKPFISYFAWTIAWSSSAARVIEAGPISLPSLVSM